MKNNYLFTTQAEVRRAFWQDHPQYQRRGAKKQNDYCADIRQLFVEYVDTLARNGTISEKLAARATL